MKKAYAGTGRNIFGRAMLSGHGRPGPIVLLKPEAIDAYCGVLSGTEKRRLYDVLAGGDERKIGELVEHIRETARSPEQTEPDGAATNSTSNSSPIK